MKLQILVKLLLMVVCCGGQAWAMDDHYNEKNKLDDVQRDDFRTVWLQMGTQGAHKFTCKDILDDITRKNIDVNKWTEVTCADSVTGLVVDWYASIIAQSNKKMISIEKFTLFTGALFNGRLDVVQELIARKLVTKPEQQLTDANLAYAVRKYRPDIVEFIREFDVFQGPLTQRAMADAQVQLEREKDGEKSEHNRENLQQTQELIAPTKEMSVLRKACIVSLVVAGVTGLLAAAKIAYDLYFSKYGKQTTHEKDNTPADNTLSGSHTSV